MNRQLQEKINEIRIDLAVDFVALALSKVDQTTKVRIIRWEYVAGNTNTHYQRIRLQVGRGIGGIVWRTGRGYQATNLQKNPAKLIELPITRIEKLETIAAHPVLQAGEVIGVLMVGYRQSKEISQELLKGIGEKSNEILAFVGEKNGK